MFVADSDSGVVGLVTVGHRHHFSGQKDAYVGELVVAEAEEGRGIGRMLMQAAEGWARSQGLQYLTLETGAANGAARAFYAALGYQEEDIRFTKGTDPVSM